MNTASEESACGLLPPGDPRSALLVVDVQNDFLPGGALAVAAGDEVIPVIMRMAPRFANIILTQDWHPAGHASFASAHAGKKPYDSITLPQGEQTLWPDHCVQGTPGADIAAALQLPQAQLLLRKGWHAGIDSYSAFMEADRATPTGLAAYLRERGITTCYLCGLATDFCVAWSALDARAAGFGAAVIEDACRGIDLNGSLHNAWTQMQAAAVERIQSAALC